MGPRRILAAENATMMVDTKMLKKSVNSTTKSQATDTFTARTFSVLADEEDPKIRKAKRRPTGRMNGWEKTEHRAKAARPMINRSSETLLEVDC